MRYLRASAVIRLDDENEPSLDVLEPGVVGITDDGRIDYVSDGFPHDFSEDSSKESGEVVELPETALVAGQVNAHSHAFQRAIRARTEYLPADQTDDDFWSWREAMYGAANQLKADELEVVARQAFSEMARAGYTTVGEFHYVHHRPDGSPYDDPNELAVRMIRAARDVGLRISLLRTAYHRGGYREPPSDRQRRFIEPDVETYLSRFDGLREKYGGDDGVTFGIAPHSIRACPSDWLVQLAGAARQRDCPLHIHVSEQRAELRQSREEYETTPIDVLDELGVLGDDTTLIHATHATTEEIAKLERARPTVCACPSTERNLGDGFLPASELVTSEVPIALGSDSQADIDPWKEMRLVEYHERLRQEARNVLATARLEASKTGSETLTTAELLWPMGAAHGARALGLETGRMEEGRWADIVGIDLDHPAFFGADTDSLPAHIAMSMPGDAVSEVWVGGERIVRDGNTSQQDRTGVEFERVMRSVYGE